MWTWAANGLSSRFREDDEGVGKKDVVVANGRGKVEDESAMWRWHIGLADGEA